MERIRRALDKARQERHAKQRHVGRLVDLSWPAGGAPDILPLERPVSEFEFTQTPVLPVDAKTAGERHILLPDSNSPYSDIYRMLRTQVLHHMQERGARTLAICSATPGEGKTLTAINLAISIASTGNETALLVDLNLRSPGVAKNLGVACEHGLDDYLRGDADVGQCLFSPGVDRLAVMPTLRPIERSSETIASPAMRGLAAELRSRYADRIIIYDMPAVMTSDDCLMFAPYLDAYLLVIENGQTDREDVIRSLELLGTEKLLGTVLNQVEDI